MEAMVRMLLGAHTKTAKQEVKPMLLFGGDKLRSDFIQNVSVLACRAQ